jgi:hypothetical protein
LSSNQENDSERSKAFNFMQERIANSRATVETDHFSSMTPPGNDTHSTFHKKTRSEDENTFHALSEDDNGMFKAFKDSEGSTENKQIQLASNAQTSDTDNRVGTTQGRKRMLVENNFDEIKEVDEYNDSFDARKQQDETEFPHKAPKINFQLRAVSDGDFQLSHKAFTKMEQVDLEEMKDQEETQDEECEDLEDFNVLQVEKKF